jgi:mono/diheme cytochrome c family protein
MTDPSGRRFQPPDHSQIAFAAGDIHHSIMFAARICDHQLSDEVDIFYRFFILKGSLLKMKLPLKLILLVIGILSAVNLFTLDQAARDHNFAGSASRGAAAPSTETLFKQKCVKCHGADGSGDTSLGRIFGTPDFTDSGWWARHSNTAEHIQVITKGKKNMPAFGKKLTKAQITGLATYVQHFRQ